MKHLIATALFLGLSQTSFAGIYDLTFGRVSSVNDRAACQAFVDAAAADLTRQSGVRIIDQGCRQDEFTVKGWDAVINYQAPARLAITSTYTSVLYSAAFYDSRNECDEHIAQQRELFTAATGLQPLVAYCMLDLGLNQNWQTRVDGLGEAQVAADDVAAIFWGTLVDPEAVLASYRSAAEGYGLKVFEVGVSSVSYEMQIVLRVFTSEPYSIEDYYSMKYESVEACSAAADAVRGVLQSAPQPVVAFCEHESLPAPMRRQSDPIPSTLHVTAFVKTLEPVSVFEARDLTNEFATLAACQQAAQGIEVGSGVFGAVCAGAGGKFRIHLFTQP